MWFDVTAEAIGATKDWTNKVEIADINGDGRPDVLFANGGDYSTPGTPEPNQVFLNTGPGFRFTEATQQVFGPTPDIARVIKARDLDNDGVVDIVVGTTYQTQSRLFLGRGAGRFAEVTATQLPAMPLSVGDLEPGDVDGDGDLDLVLADWGPGNNMSNDGGRTRLWLNDGKGRFTDATETRMPDIKVRFSWDLELADVDNDFDLDVLVSCKRCPGSHLFRNDGAGTFVDDGAGDAAVHEQLRVRGDGPRRRRVSRPGDDERRRDCGRGQLEPARARVPQRRQGSLSRRNRRPGGPPRTTSARTTTWRRSSTSTRTVMRTSSSAR